jgi:hypothetical protein
MGAGETTLGQTDHFAPSDKYRGFYHAVKSDQGDLRSAVG